MANRTETRRYQINGLSRNNCKRGNDNNTVRIDWRSVIIRLTNRIKDAIHIMSSKKDKE